MRNLLLAAALLVPLAAHAQQAPAQIEAPRYMWRPMTGCTSGTLDALKHSLAAKGIKFETGNDGPDISWTDPRDGQDEYANFFHGQEACVAFRRSDDNDWFAYADKPFGCVEVIPTQQQVIDFHRKKDPQVVAKCYEDGNVIVITSRRPGSKLHIVSIRGKKDCQKLGAVYYNAPAGDLAAMKSRNL